MSGALVPLVIVAGLPFLVYLSIRRGNLARVEIADGQLVVRPRGLNGLWAFNTELRIPLSAVTRVRRDASRANLPSGLRMPGTYVPRLIQAGTYRSGGQKSSWLVGRTATVTVIECPGAQVDRIVLQLSDQTAAEVQRAVPNRAS